MSNLTDKKYKLDEYINADGELRYALRDVELFVPTVKPKEGGDRVYEKPDIRFMAENANERTNVSEIPVLFNHTDGKEKDSEKPIWKKPFRIGALRNFKSGNFLHAVDNNGSGKITEQETYGVTADIIDMDENVAILLKDGAMPHRSLGLGFRQDSLDTPARAEITHLALLSSADIPNHRFKQFDKNSIDLADITGFEKIEKTDVFENTPIIIQEDNVSKKSNSNKKIDDMLLKKQDRDNFSEEDLSMKLDKVIALLEGKTDTKTETDGGNFDDASKKLIQDKIAYLIETEGMEKEQAVAAANEMYKSGKLSDNSVDDAYVDSNGQVDMKEMFDMFSAKFDQIINLLGGADDSKDNDADKDVDDNTDADADTDDGDENKRLAIAGVQKLLDKVRGEGKDNSTDDTKIDDTKTDDEKIDNNDDNKSDEQILKDQEQAKANLLLPIDKFEAELDKIDLDNFSDEKKIISKDGVLDAYRLMASGNFEDFIKALVGLAGSGNVGKFKAANNFDGTDSDIDNYDGNSENTLWIKPDANGETPEQKMAKMMPGATIEEQKSAFFNK